MATGKVFNTKQYAIELADGRTLAPSDYAENVDLDDPHNAGMISDKHLRVIQPKAAPPPPPPPPAKTGKPGEQEKS